MKTTHLMLAVSLVLSSSSIACTGPEREPEASVSEAVAADPAMLVGTYQFVYTDARRAAVEAALAEDAKSAEELREAKADAEREAAESRIEFAADGTFHSRIADKEILAAPYQAKGASGSTLVLTMRGPSGEEKRTTVRFHGADTIVIDDPKKGELTFRRVSSRG